MPYFYVIHSRASVNGNESVYKIGKTNDFSKRVSGYDKGSIPLLMVYVNDSDKFERNILEILGRKFTKRTDYGNEYFEGNLGEIISNIYQYFEENPEYLYEREGSSISRRIYSSEEIEREYNKILGKLNKYTPKNIGQFDEKLRNLNSQNLQTSWANNVFLNFRNRISTWMFDINNSSWKGSKKYGDNFLTSQDLRMVARYAYGESNEFQEDALKLVEKIKLM